MKRQADISSFTPGIAGAGTVVFGTIAPTDIKQILLVTDVTSQTIIYNPFDSSKGGTYNSGTKTLTLELVTTGLTGTNLQAFFWDESAGFGQKTMANSSPVVIASDQTDLVIVGEESSVSLELTRPADTNAYIAKDTVSDSTSAPTVLTFANLSRANGKGGYIVKAQLMTDQKTCTSRFRLHLYDTSPTAINDNAAFGLLYANAATRLGYIDFPACSTEDSTASTGAMSLRDDLRLKYLPTGASRAIYGLLETLDAFTPASGQKIHIRLSVDNN